MISVDVGSNHRSIHHPKGSLLETLESASVRVESHCRNGFCGACRTKLVKGEVEYFTEPLAFVEDDEILPCCCKSKSQNLSIKII
jgi:ferredoxin